MRLGTERAPAAMIPPPAPTGELRPADRSDDTEIRFEDHRRRGGMRCPHCRSIANRRSSAEVTPLFWDIYYVCSDPRCGHTWKASLSYVYGLSPSAVPDPDLDLPLRIVTREEVVRTGPEPPDPNQPGLFED